MNEMRDVSIVKLDELVSQGWKEVGIPAVRRRVEEVLWKKRKELVAELRAKGYHAVCWGYVRRKHLQTPVGDLGPIRVPRIRADGREVRIIPRYVRRVESLNAMVAEATIFGISQRRMGAWMRRANGQSVSVPP